MAAVGLASVGTGLLIAAQVTRSRLIEGLPTPALIGLLGLLVLPVLTLAALEVHRRAPRSVARDDAEPGAEPAWPVGPATGDAAEQPTHYAIITAARRDAPSVEHRTDRCDLHRHRAARASP